MVTGMAATIGDVNNNIVSLVWNMTGATIASSPMAGINNLESHTFAWGTTRVSLTVTDRSGRSTSCYFDVTVNPCEAGGGYCTYTQGFYGNVGGKTCDGSAALDIMKDAFWNGLDYVPYVDFGAVAGTPNPIATDKTFRLYFTDIYKAGVPTGQNNIFKMLPGGGSPSALKGYATYSSVSTWKNVSVSTKSSSYGKLNNNLLAQTITLWFNKQNDDGLGSFLIKDRFIISTEGESCGSDIAIPNAEMVYSEVPQSVIDYFEKSKLRFTVDNLFISSQQSPWRLDWLQRDFCF